MDEAAITMMLVLALLVFTGLAQVLKMGIQFVVMFQRDREK